MPPDIAAARRKPPPMASHGVNPAHKAVKGCFFPLRPPWPVPFWRRASAICPECWRARPYPRHMAPHTSMNWPSFPAKCAPMRPWLASTSPLVSPGGLRAKMDCLSRVRVPFTCDMTPWLPAGTWLLLWPCFWSIALAAPAGSLPDVGLLISFGIGATVLRGAGCTINDLCDRDLDGSVERTRSRPLAAGDVSVAQAIGEAAEKLEGFVFAPCPGMRPRTCSPFCTIGRRAGPRISRQAHLPLATLLPASAFLALQTAVGVGWMASLNPSALQLGLSSLGLVAAYPLMKRITDWPQVSGGSVSLWKLGALGSAVPDS